MSIHMVAQGRAKIEWSEQNVATFTVCRTRRRNALDLETIEALSEFVDELDKRPHITTAIFTGAGDSFVSGGDLKQFMSLRGEKAGRAISRRVGEILSRLEDLPQVTIAALNGDAYGGGAEFALACDLRVIDEDAAIIFSQARFGLTSAWGGMLRLTRLIGYSRALDFFLTKRRIEATEALTLGLVNRVTPPGEALTQSHELALEITNLGAPLSSSLKRVARAAATSDQDDAFAEERRIFAQLWASPQHERLVSDFMAPKIKLKTPT